MRRVPVAVCAAFLAAASAFAAGWPTEGRDARRTGQSDVRGPRSAAIVKSIVLPSEQAVNMPVTIADDGTLYVGTWGMVRTGGATNPSQWDKFDGKIFAFRRDLSQRWMAHADHVPYCYSYAGREETDGCGGGTANGYNGTVEGTPAIDEARNRIYVGRGDGKLYAYDATHGTLLWRFTTFNPVDPADPEGGGEVVAGPLVAADGAIYIATVAAGTIETNAVYAISPEGSLLWRYPHAARSMPQVVWAAPALSPDDRTLYVAGGWGPAANIWDKSQRGAIYAFDLTRSGTGDARLKWKFEPINEGEWWKPTVWTTSMAVGSDGTIYAAGNELVFGFGGAVLFALRDLGSRADYAWSRMVDLDRGRASVSQGLALREVNGQTMRVYATSGNLHIAALGYPPGGKLYAVNPANGNSIWTFDPEAHGGTGAMTGMAIDADGVVYTGVSGAQDGGRIFAIDESGSLLWQTTIGGLMEWAHPVLGPRGDLYFAETRRCLWMLFPVETGACNSFDVSPRLYGVMKGDPRKRSAGH